MTMTPLDLSNLTPAQLDDLIAAAVKRRAALEPRVSSTRPTPPVEALLNQAWYVQGLEIGTLLQLQHPGLGWISFIIPPAERRMLISYLQQQEASNANAAVPASGNESQPAAKNS